MLTWLLRYLLDLRKPTTKTATILDRRVYNGVNTIST